MEGGFYSLLRRVSKKEEKKGGIWQFCCAGVWCILGNVSERVVCHTIFFLLLHHTEGRTYSTLYIFNAM